MAAIVSAYEEEFETKTAEGEIDSEIITKLEQHKQKLDNYEKAMKNGDLPTLLEIFLDLLEQPNLGNFQNLVLSLNKAMSKMFESMNDLREFAGDKAIKEIQNIITKFEHLLRRTKKAILELTTDAADHKENLDDLIECVEQINASDFDKNEFEDGTNKLTKWIDDTTISNIAQEWNLFVKECESLHLKWKQFAEQAKSRLDSVIEGSSSVLKSLGWLGMIGGAVSMCVAGIIFAPTLLASAGIAGASAFIVSGAGSIAGTLLTGGAITVAAGILMSGAGKTMDKAAHTLASDILAQSEKIRDGLLKMIVFGKTIEDDLNDLDNIRGVNMEKNIKSLQNDIKSRKKFIKISKKIIDYLDEYIKKGKTIMNDIDNAQNIVKDLVKQHY